MLSHNFALTWNEALSGIFGSISLAAWNFLLVPQLIENYTQGSADGISLTFLLIWFVGDVTNLVGAIWAGLVPTVVALAIYFCFADTVLISQVVYYKYMVGKRPGKGELDETNGHIIPAGEETPLLNGDNATQAQTKKRHSLTDVDETNIGLPGSHRRRSTNRTHSSSMQRDNTLDRILEEPTETRAWVKNTVSVLLVIAAGTAGWALAWKAGAWRPSPIGQKEDEHGMPVGAEILGYASAICYLGARIPQIVKNQQERSCDGLSLLFFLLSLLGNATYGAGVSNAKQDGLTRMPSEQPMAPAAITAGAASPEVVPMSAVNLLTCTGLQTFIASASVNLRGSTIKVLCLLIPSCPATSTSQLSIEFGKRYTSDIKLPSYIPLFGLLVAIKPGQEAGSVPQLLDCRDGFAIVSLRNYTAVTPDAQPIEHDCGANAMVKICCKTCNQPQTLPGSFIRRPPSLLRVFPMSRFARAFCHADCQTCLRVSQARHGAHCWADEVHSLVVLGIAALCFVSTIAMNFDKVQRMSQTRVVGGVALGFSPPWSISHMTFEVTTYLSCIPDARYQKRRLQQTRSR
nr:putative vacuolar amino acid transporter ypq3 [Quercus suber]